MELRVLLFVCYVALIAEASLKDARQASGLICYECQTTNPTFQDCTSLKICPNGEICLYEKRSTSVSTDYTMGCATPQVCNGQALIVGRRARSPASEQPVHERDTTIDCCTTNFCNLPSSTSTMPPTTITTTLTPTTLPTFIQTCDVSNGYTLLNDNQGSTTLCVKVHSEAKLWENARTQCRQEGGDLVVLDSPLKLHLIQTELTSMGLDDGVMLWIGAHEMPTLLPLPRHFNWANGQPVDMSYGWAPGEPEGYNQHCVTINHAGGYTLHDNICWFIHKFICQRL
ncbi:uncharacterized protein LOC127835020 isoform X2 [Dreissena polymorpha]|uniref:uncharacterized protein LOC127835020 isoform X1 n=1 Tax=Dreissena polymorpha TaxID=45954 RepID=UPI0022653577|nr:uncharacterized protein LOC127835020 isoform X1 [Dreissena polymorpha]XP_052217154.1 uncharacterized protein LOC127835020 isoform X2 [Dreissena polymorpha]